MPTLTPTGGTTYCTVKMGSFSRTYDNKTSTGACFRTDQACLSEWYWSNPVNVTKLRLFTETYYPDSRIHVILGRVGGSLVRLWSGDWRPRSLVWDSKVISCDNCTGIQIGQTHARQTMMPCLYEVKVDYEEVVAEGKAVITGIDLPSSFTRNVPFNIVVHVRNDGGEDTFFARIIDRDTGAILVTGGTSPMPPGYTWVHNLPLTLTQTTDFHGRVEAGHEE